MDIQLKDKFIELWRKYFVDADLPLIFYYTDKETQGNLVELKRDGPGFQCFIGNLKRVADGEDLRFERKSFGCPGGLAYTGFQQIKMPNFEYFLSCGIEGKMVGERYKRTPELATAYHKSLPHFEAPAKYLVFKRWDKLIESDQPEVVIFFATPDVLSGLFTLSNFEEGGSTNVVAPFVAGCGSIVMWPSVERSKTEQRSFLGMFDVSARPAVSKNVLSLAIPFDKFARIVECMEESFVITHSWDKIKDRLAKE